jgi:serine/threonine protein kinase/WD40 repeat protein
VACVSEQELRAFQLGTLPESCGQAVAAHLERCPDCERLARQLDGLTDLVISSVREALQDGERTPALGGETGGAGHLPGSRVGGYTILEEVGRGGMAVVYKARQLLPDRVVALKVLLTGCHSNAERRDRFRREAETIARLRHPHIVQVYEAGEAEGLPYLTLEFCEGGSLARRLGGRPQLPTVAAALVEKVARAVHHAHQAGVVHRDLKPSNVLLQSNCERAFGRNEDGASSSGGPSPFLPDASAAALPLADCEPKVTDFGLAKQTWLDLTATGAVLGTPGYMAPEQAGGSDQIGAAADVYGLGAILYELLTGRPPFQGATALETLEQTRSQEPVPPSQLQAKTPRDLNTVCLKCLHKEPSRRYASAADLAEDLRRFLEGKPIRARPVSALERGWRWCRRKPALAVLLSSVALLLVAVAAISSVYAVRLDGALTETKAAERKARLREAEALVGQARGYRYSRRSGQRFEALAALKRAATIGRELDQPAEWFDRLRNEAIAALALPDLSIAQTFNGFPPGTVSADVSHDLELYARAMQDGTCSVRRIADDREVKKLPAVRGNADVAFGPGRLLLRKDDSGQVQLWDLTAAREPYLLERNTDCWMFRPDGRLLVLSHHDGSLAVYETDTGICRYRLRAKGITRGCYPSLHPTAEIVAVCSYFFPLIQVRDLRSEAVLDSLEVPEHGAWRCEWAPDGRTLAVSGGEDSTLRFYTFNLASSRLCLDRNLSGLSSGGTQMCWSPAGDLLAARGWSWKSHLFDAVTGLPLFSTDSAYPGDRLRFGPAGTVLAATRVGPRQEQIGLWSVAAGREYTAVIHPGRERGNHDCLFPAIHPAGRLIAYEIGVTRTQRANYGTALFDLETRREVAFIPVAEGGGNPCFDGAGNLYTNGPTGLFRWPVRPDRENPRRLTVGPKERLPFPARGDRTMSTSRDGRVVAQATFGSGAWVLNADTRQARLLSEGRFNYVASSRDGLWVVCGGFHNVRVNVFEAATGKRVWESPNNNDYCRFSTDGRWLLTDSNVGGQAFAVPTWTPGARLGPGRLCDVSADGRLTALVQPDGIVRLVEIATGRELARLEPPDQSPTFAVFTPDGTRLVCSAEDGLRVWDLRRIRRGLDELGLDWDAPPYPEAPAEVADRPAEVRVVTEAKQ